uniref:Gustatory receptor n=1 Tax=Daphnia galeata TaxID=27404 RepID=A0A8J2WLH0_9CRUS|nr:unnamed protein product [Daphnia galeata]
MRRVSFPVERFQRIEKSLWPLIVGLRVLGFHVGPASSSSSSSGIRKRSSSYSVCLLFTGSLMVLSTVALHCTSFVYGVLRLKANEIGANGTNLTTTKLLNIGIEHLNYTWVLIGVHVTFFYVTLTSGWTELWDTLIVIEDNLKFNSTFYIKCRRSVLIGFGFLFLDCVTHLFVSLRSFYWDMGFLSPLALVLANISRTTIISVFLLFCILVRVITLIFQGLNEQLFHLNEPEKFSSIYSSNRILNIRLEKWRRNHTLVCRLIEMINKCFGLVMVITVVNVFISFITTTFEIVNCIQESDTIPFMFVSIFLKKSCLLTISIYEPYRLQAEVSRTAVALRTIHPMTADLLTQIKLNTVVVEITHATPKITAMELFDVQSQTIANGSLMVLSTVALHCTSFVYGVLRLKVNGLGPNGTNLTTANLLNIGIEHLNYTLVLIGIHTTFFFVSLTSNWTDLWDSLLLIEKNLQFNSTFYAKCKKSVLIGFVFLLMDCASHILISIRSFYWDMGWMSPLANISRTTIISVFLLFCVMARVITLVFQGLNEQIIHMDEDDQFSPFYLTSRILNARLEKWRRNHTLACELVELVNKCFGLVMVITVVNVFLSFITTTFEIVRSMQDDATIPVLFVVIFVKKSILLSIIIYEPYRLQAEARLTAVSLRKLQPCTADLLSQIKLNTVVIEVTHASPKITAMEFFDVNRRLLPTLIGSTLTYVAILCQASSSAHSTFK